ncbi:MAG: lipid-A-disaccharide synthase [Acidobacteria bacterium]|nr:lipid-A-disaccharide synthase [Acidobacteriota bacterium]
MKLLVSAGEASGDQYAAWLVETLQQRWAGMEFFGCAGAKLRAAGVRPVVEAERLAVVGLVEVLGHVPRIYGEFRKLCAAAEAERPQLAVLTDSPDFHLRLAKKLHRLGIPIVYLVAPQVWAWRGWRIRLVRRVVTRLLCIFPFEEAFFRRHGVAATYIGHPLAGRLAPSLGRAEFFRKHRLAAERPLIAVLPGSRRGEAARHLPILLEAVKQLNAWRAMNFVLAASPTTGQPFLAPRIAGSGIKIVEGETCELLTHADLALVASGTATVEAALLGAPMVIFYRVQPATWLLGKWFVRTPYYSMVNLLAERKIVPELIQSDFTAQNLAGQARRLLEEPARINQMRQDLAEVAGKLSGGKQALARAADVVEELLGLGGAKIAEVRKEARDAKTRA